MPDLCLGGGVALNGVANARILAESGFERVFVPSAPGDAGCALGAALYADRIYFANPDRDVPDHPFWGPRWTAGELARAAAQDGQWVEELDDAPLIERVADNLAAGRIVAWMDGASEFGPRALGHRSILAAPHSRKMRDRLNRDIKRREEFRPFAPVTTDRDGRPVLRAAAGRRTARALHVRCVSGAARVRSQLAAITHVDGSARLQVVERSMAPRLYSLLQAYGRRSGMPVLLNTSFNVAGEPIVNRAPRRLFHVPALRHRRARGRAPSWSRNVRSPASSGGGGCMITKRGRIRRRLIMLASAGGSIADLMRGLWRSDSGKRWLVPLAVFLCLFGLVLILATTVEALAPFIYAIF